jgi:lipase
MHRSGRSGRYELDITCGGPVNGVLWRHRYQQGGGAHMRVTIAIWLLTYSLMAGCQRSASPEHDSISPNPAPFVLQTFNEGQGPPLVMLLANDYRVLRPQSIRIEHNQNKKPLPPNYSIKLESASLARSLDELGIREPLHIVGHSFGALVALDFALDHPNRVRTLVLYEPPAFWVIPPEDLRADEEMRGMVELTQTLGPTDEPTDEQLKQFQARLGRSEVQVPTPGQLEWKDWVAKRSALRGLSAVPNHRDDPRRLYGFTKPVLIVTGEETVGFHRRINDILADSLPMAERVELPGGHRGLETSREELVSQLRSFLERHR